LSVAILPGAIEFGWRGCLGRVTPMADAADDLDVNAMLQRFRERADAVKDRPLPPVAGAERQQFIEQAELDYMDYAIVADATWTFEDGILTLRVDLRPQDS
jgi:hypothetical protein